MNALYLSYNGILEPLGRNQVVIYPLLMAQAGYRLSLISFEKPLDLADRAAVASMRQHLAERGVSWHPLRYHQRPSLLGTLWDILRGIVLALRLALRQRFDLLHVRSYLPLLIALPLRRLQRSAMIFDMRGLWADERAETGGCRRGGLQYRMIKRLERAGLRRADVVVTLSECARQILREDPASGVGETPIEVVPCFIDTQRFQSNPERRTIERARRGWQDQRVVVYAGSLGGIKQAEPIARCFAAGLALDPKLRLLLLTPNQSEQLRATLAQAGLPEQSWQIDSVRPEHMQDALSCADMGLALVQPTFSQLAAWPIKLGEYLSMGLPVLITPHIGDTESFLRQHGVGATIPELTAAGYAAGMQELLRLVEQAAELPARCRAAAIAHLDLNSTGRARYLAIYQQALERARAKRAL